MEAKQHTRTNWIVLVVAAAVLAMSVRWEIWIRTHDAWPSAMPYILGGASLVVIIAQVVLAFVRR